MINVRIKGSYKIDFNSDFLDVFVSILFIIEPNLTMLIPSTCKSSLKKAIFLL